MIRKDIPNGWYADAMPFGEYACLRFDGRVETHLGDLPYAGTSILFPVVTNIGGFRVAGQPHGLGNQNLEFSNGQWNPVGLSHGVNPVIYDNFGVLHNATPAQGSQGYRFVDANNRLWTGDETYADPVRQIWEWTELGSITVGFSNGGVVALWQGTRRVIAPGSTYGANSVNFKRDGSRCVVTFHNKANLTTTILWFDEPELAGFPLEAVPVEEPVPAIGKPCWLGWFEFVEPVNPAPHNCLLRVQQQGLISSAKGPIAQWVQGSSVEEIEQAASETLQPAVAYWDARNWPRWPVLPGSAYCAIQAYRGVNESLANFEADIRRLATEASNRYNKVALVCQCYTSNTGNTSDLSSLPPVYARVARDFPKVSMLLVFSDEGRATGLNHHPEVRPRWQDLFNGIVGTPGESMNNGIVNGVLVDPQAWFFSKVQGRNPADYQNVLRELEPELFHFGIGQQTDGSGNVLRGRLFLPWGACPNASPRPSEPQDVKYHVNQTPPCCGIGEVPCLQVDVVNNPPTQWIWNVGGGKTMEDYVPVEHDAPPASELTLAIWNYPETVRRAEVGGLVVTFEAGGPKAVKGFELWLNDGAPRFVLAIVPPGIGFDPGEKDGRYFRTFGWKPDRNGTFNLFMKAVDIDGGVIEVQGSHPVTITE